MITYNKVPAVPLFSEITAMPGQAKLTPEVRLLPPGHVIHEGLARLQKDFPPLKVLCRIVMPDHLHFLIFVREPTAETLGTMLATFSSHCTTALRQAGAIAPGLSFFTPGFNDKIAYNPGSKDAFYNYVVDNPRRYLVKKLYPQYFRNMLALELNGRQLAIYGNFFLLDNPVKSAVRISSRDTIAEHVKKTREWDETVRSLGALVSPFISPEEKKWRDRAIAEGARIILIVNYTFSERSKPHRTLFDLCEQGRLLIVSTGRYAAEQKTITRAEALEMNDIAASISRLSPRAYRLRPR